MTGRSKLIATLAVALAAGGSMVYWNNGVSRDEPGNSDTELAAARTLCAQYVPHVSAVQDMGLGRVQVQGTVKDTTWTCVVNIGAVDTHTRVVNHGPH